MPFVYHDWASETIEAGLALGAIHTSTRLLRLAVFTILVPAGYQKFLASSATLNRGKTDWLLEPKPRMATSALPFVLVTLVSWRPYWLMAPIGHWLTIARVN